MNGQDLPLFPLATVLFPGGHLALRIFETRYLDMVRECAAHQRPFGVCALLQDDGPAGARSGAAAVGTLARIVDFSTHADGLLGIQTVGGQRFRVLTSRVSGNGLLRGDLQLLDDPPALPVPPEYGLVATLMARLLEQAGDQLPRHLRQQMDDASWLAWRMGELLPLSIEERQRLLETDDPRDQLQQLVEILPRFQRD